ncbi:MAG TPA: glycosyltransferase family 39 protein [Candidatus Saccharimonadia bacterium]|nr:glycosyltransferase family 39 protein [Candidatus Saccharimonadia bacterium]
MKKELLFVLVLLVVATALRFWQFHGYLEFLDDQGRDAIVAKQILVNHNLTLLGPGTSIGKMYLGPLYYYVMVPFLALTYPDPSGPAYMIAVLGIVTVVLIYTLGKRLVGRRAAAMAALLYAVAPSIVQLSRFSWQPNPAPFVGLLMMWLTYTALKGKTWHWFWVAVCFAVLIQLHYVALLSAIPSAIFFAYDYWKRRRQKLALRTYLAIIVASIAMLVISQLPLIVFDILHHGLIREGFAEFFAAQQRHAPLLQHIWLILANSQGRGMYITIEQFGLSNQLRSLNGYLLDVFIVVVILQFLPRYLKHNPRALQLKIVTAWVATALIGLSIYTDTVYVHYFAYVLPAVFLLLGASFSFISERHVALKWGSYGVVAAAVMLNIITSPYWKPKVSDIERVKQVSTDLEPFVSGTVRYNIALLNDNREYRGMKYRYFFETTQNPPQSQYDYNNLDKLIVITENGEDPLGSPIFEIQQFRNETKNPVVVTSREYQSIVHAYVFERPTNAK